MKDYKRLLVLTFVFIVSLLSACKNYTLNEKDNSINIQANSQTEKNNQISPSLIDDNTDRINRDLENINTIIPTPLITKNENNSSSQGDGNNQTNKNEDNVEAMDLIFDQQWKSEKLLGGLYNNYSNLLSNDYEINADTGEVIDLPYLSGLSIDSKSAINKNYIVLYDKLNIIAIDKLTGERLMVDEHIGKLSDENQIYGKIVIDDEYVYLHYQDGNFICKNIKTGQVLWQKYGGAYSFFYVIDKKVYIYSNKSKAFECWSSLTGEVEYYIKIDEHYSVMYIEKIDANFLVLHSVNRNSIKDNKISLFNISDKKLEWDTAIEDYGVAPLDNIIRFQYYTASDNYIILPTIPENRPYISVCVIDRQTGEVIKSIPVDVNLKNVPNYTYTLRYFNIFDDHLLFVKDDEVLMSIDLNNFNEKPECIDLGIGKIFKIEYIDNYFYIYADTPTKYFDLYKYSITTKVQ